MPFRLSDGIEPTVFLDYMAKNTTEKSDFVESGIIVQTPELDAIACDGSKFAEMPFFKDLANDEPNIVNDNPADLSEPNKVGTDSQLTRKAYLHQSWSDMDLASEILGVDPLEHISSRVVAYWHRQRQRRVLAMVKGLIAANVAQNDSDMVIDVSNDSAGVPTAGELFSRANFTDAAFTLGDRFESVGAIVVHSRVQKRMIDNDDIDYVADSKGNMTIPMFLGRRVIVDDGMPAVKGTNRTKFTSVLFGPAAFGFGEGKPSVPIAVTRNESAGNGGGMEELHSRKTWLLHPQGYKFTSAAVVGMSPTLAELANPANWERVFEERKQLPFAFLTTNG